MSGDLLSNYLKSAIGDPRRRSAESKIRKPTDKLVYVEGDFDYELFGKIWSHRKEIKIQPAFSQGTQGKDGVFDLVSRFNKSLGIVDMDHDFSGHTIGQHPRVIDTRDKCCLHAYFFDYDQKQKFIDCITRETYPHSKSDRVHLNNKLSFYWLKIIELAAERTKARLFRGKSRIRFIAADSNDWIAVDDFVAMEADFVGDLIPNESLDDFNKFKQKYADLLENIGINDHAIEEIVCSFINSYGPKNLNRYKISKIFQTASIKFISSIKHSSQSRTMLKQLIDADNLDV